jgi:UDP-glucose:(heptosyl)LPS alpha-1,3-glucosyltransferase
MRSVDVAKRLRIALLSDHFGRKFGGAESYGVNLFEILAQRHDVTVISHAFDHDLPVKEILVKCHSIWPSWMRVCFFSMRAKRLTQSGYDIVHSHMSGGVGDVQVIHVTPIRFRRLFGRNWFRRFLAWMQLSNFAYLKLEAASVRTSSCRHVVAVSPWLRDRLFDAYGPQLKLDVIPPGASPVTFDSQLRDRVRVDLGWTPTDVGCLLVARNPLRKGFAAVLDAMALLPSTFKLAVVGAEPAVHDFLDTHHPELIDRVSLIEPTSNVSPFYQAADVYVHPTLMDSFGMAPLEAMAHGLPVIVSGPKYCGFGQYVKHLHDAWVLDDPEDSVAIAKGLYQLGTSTATREKLLQHSELLVQSLSWRLVAEKYEALYEDCLAHKGHVR